MAATICPDAKAFVEAVQMPRPIGTGTANRLVLFSMQRALRPPSAGPRCLKCGRGLTALAVVKATLAPLFAATQFRRPGTQNQAHTGDNTMKTTFASGLLRLVILSAIAMPSYGLVLTDADMVKSCSVAAGDPERLTVFLAPYKLHVAAYDIPVFRLNSKTTSSLDLVVLLKRGSDTDAEIPIFKGICANQNIKPMFDKKTGKITFTTKSSDIVRMRFRLDDPRLKRTKWRTKGKPSGNDAIWMREAPMNSSDPPEPNSSDWPCPGGKQVSISDDGLDVFFDLCPNEGKPHLYIYTLRLEQRGNEQTTIVAEIDPQIIHRPN